MEFFCSALSNNVQVSLPTHLAQTSAVRHTSDKEAFCLWITDLLAALRPNLKPNGLSGSINLRNFAAYLRIQLKLVWLLWWLVWLQIHRLINLLVFVQVTNHNCVSVPLCTPKPNCPKKTIDTRASLHTKTLLGST